MSCYCYDDEVEMVFYDGYILGSIYCFDLGQVGVIVGF